MNNNENNAETTATPLPEIGTHFKLLAEYAKSKKLYAENVYSIIEWKKIGKNVLAVAIELDTDDPQTIRVQHKNMIIVETPKIVRPTAHSACDHPATKSARAACRRERAKSNES